MLIHFLHGSLLACYDLCGMVCQYHSIICACNLSAHATPENIIAIWSMCMRHTCMLTLCPWSVQAGAYLASTLQIQTGPFWILHSAMRTSDLQNETPIPCLCSVSQPHWFAICCILKSHTFVIVSHTDLQYVVY